MRRFLVFLIVFLASVFIGWKIAQDPGVAFFSYQSWSMEMPLWFAVLAAIVVMYIFYILVHLSDDVDFSFYRWKNWLRWRRRDRSYTKTSRGLLELIEGQWKNAEHYLLEGILQSNAPLINYLAAAKAAQEQGNFDKRDMYLRKAHDVSPHAEIAIGLTQAQLQYAQGQFEQALATLNHLRSIAPKHKVVLKLLERVYVGLGDWTALMALLPNLRKAKIVPDKEYAYFESKIYEELLKSTEQTQDLVHVRALWNTIPKKFRLYPSLLITYAHHLLPYAEAAPELEVIISQALKKNWDEELVRLYGLVPGEDPHYQLSKAEEWLKIHPDNAVLLLALGRIAVRCQLWGKARGYFESSLKIHPSAEAYASYGKLLELLGDQAAAAESYRTGLFCLPSVK